MEKRQTMLSRGALEPLTKRGVLGGGLASQHGPKQSHMSCRLTPANQPGSEPSGARWITFNMRKGVRDGFYKHMGANENSLTAVHGPIYTVYTCPTYNAINVFIFARRTHVFSRRPELSL